MILQQAKILSEMKKATWDLDSTDTFKKKITIVVFYNNTFWCVCVCVGGGVRHLFKSVPSFVVCNGFSLL